MSEQGGNQPGDPPPLAPVTGQPDEQPANAVTDDMFPAEVSCLVPFLVAKRPRVVFGALFGLLIGTEVIYRPFIGVYPMPMYWLIGPALLGLGLFLVLPRPRWTIGAVIDQDRFLFLDSKGNKTLIEPAEVMLISGLCGLDLEGGDLLGPTTVRILTTAGTFSLKLGQHVAPTVYIVAAHVCEHAVRLPFKGGAYVPDAINPDERSAWLEDVRHLVSVELGKVIRNAWIGAAFTMLIVGAAGAVVTIAIMNSSGPGAGASGGMAKMAIAAVVAVVCAFVLTGLAIKATLRRKRLLRLLRS